MRGRDDWKGSTVRGYLSRLCCGSNSVLILDPGAFIPSRRSDSCFLPLLDSTELLLLLLFGFFEPFRFVSDRPRCEFMCGVGWCLGWMGCTMVISRVACFCVFSCSR